VNRKFAINLTSLVILLNLSSCSWLAHRESLFGDSDKTPEPAEAQAPRGQESKSDKVSREEYEQLKNRYDILMNEKNGNVQTAKEGDVVADLQKAKSTDEVAETVNVFASSKDSKESVAGAGELEEQIGKIRKAEELMSVNKFNDAIALLKNLEKSSQKYIVAYSKFLIAEGMFTQGNYDLSMQIYEEIINKYAFSGVVLKALGRLIVCAEKLKLEKKREQYFSLFQDVFEAS
jgi:tetratricopeptide (TPR) repeat protein